jgi:16S rRNA (guanine527-N7)-methyltransferase
MNYREFWKSCPEWVCDKQPALDDFAQLIREWNENINVVSRKDTDELEYKHILPCLAISKIIKFKQGSKILDVGSGGGFPGLPMAIIYPESEFTLLDSVGKKIKVLDDVILRLKLKNVRTCHSRVEDIKERFDFISGRAVSALPQFIPWVRDKLKSKHKNELKNGIFYWKGGELEPELKSMKLSPTSIFPLNDILSDQNFDGKYIAYFNFK